MSKWKKALIVIAIVAVSGAAYGIYLFNKKPADVRILDARFKLTATELVDAFNKDETAANAKYLDQVLSVTGNVADIKIDSANQVTIFLESGDPLSSVTCSFYDEEANAVSNLQKGLSVNVKGKCTGKLMDVVLNKCSLTK